MSKQSGQRTTDIEKEVKSMFADFSRKLESAKTLRAGSFKLRLTGEGGADYYIHATNSKCEASTDPGSGPSHFEVVGDARRIRAILDGSKDGQMQFYAGGILIRGDLRYLSDLAYELGIIKEPF
jgi:hypothetical protein